MVDYKKLDTDDLGYALQRERKAFNPVDENQTRTLDISQYTDEVSGGSSLLPSIANYDKRMSLNGAPTPSHKHPMKQTKSFDYGTDFPLLPNKSKR